jgi:hypothetical protein
VSRCPSDPGRPSDGRHPGWPPAIELLDAVELLVPAPPTVLGGVVVTDTGLLVAVIGATAVEAGGEAWWTGGSLSNLTLVTVAAW